MNLFWRYLVLWCQTIGRLVPHNIFCFKPPHRLSFKSRWGFSEHRCSGRDPGSTFADLVSWRAADWKNQQLRRTTPKRHCFFDDGRVEVNICAIESISKIQMDTGLQKCPHASEKDKVWGLVLTNASQIIAIFSYFWICHFNSFSQFSLMVLDTRLDSLCNDPSGRLHIMYMFCLT